MPPPHTQMYADHNFSIISKIFEIQIFIVVCGFRLKNKH